MFSDNPFGVVSKWWIHPKNLGLGSDRDWQGVADAGQVFFGVGVN